MKTSRLPLAVAAVLFLPTAALAASPSPAGWAVDESDCASGGPTTYFFADGLVIKEDCGDDCPVILEGTWKQKGEELHVRWSKRFFGKGTVPEDGPTPARTIYKDYAGAFEQMNEGETFAWTGEADDEGCTRIARHDKRPDARRFLRTEFIGIHAFTMEREVDADDLAGLSKAELEIMRNEIYARYGHTFKNARLRKHFEKQVGYRARFTEVSAFLSPLERKNVAAILEAEKRAK